MMETSTAIPTVFPIEVTVLRLLAKKAGKNSDLAKQNIQYLECYIRCGKEHFALMKLKTDEFKWTNPQKNVQAIHDVVRMLNLKSF